MLKAHEIDRVNTILSDLEKNHDLRIPPSPGPYGRTLGAIRAYRALARNRSMHEPELVTLSELICLYAIGILRGDGAGITPFPPRQP